MAKGLVEGKRPHPPFGHLPQRGRTRWSTSLNGRTVGEVCHCVASPLEKLSEGLMRSLLAQLLASSFLISRDSAASTAPG